jgi:cobyrinic acid a,c-diamide synthase
VVTSSLPRVLVAAPASGQGKTTVATGLIAALARRGLSVSGHKVGPDYIDPGYHAAASGRPGRNLDPHLVGEELVVPLLKHGAAGADVAVVEGVMGLFDGRVGTRGFASSAHVAALTGTPVLLVVDAARASRSVGAVVHGMATWDPSVRVAGVVLNRVGSPRHVAELRDSIDVPVLGAIPRDEAVAAPSRHLGLVPAAERDVVAESLAPLAELVEAHIDLDAVLALARTAPDLSGDPWDPAATMTGATGGGTVAVAGGRAFTFRYAETDELLRAAGCRVEVFDPLTDAGLPDGTSALYLGGGFPEVHADELAANKPLLREVREAVLDGLPTVAECAGLLYLSSTLDGRPMVGALPADAVMSDRLTMRYPEARTAADSLLGPVGTAVTGHEFHRTVVTPEHGPTPAWVVTDPGGDLVEGFASETLHASYLHTHWAGHPHLARAFAEAAHG